MSKRKKPAPKPRHVPQRTCIACRQTGGKRELIRIVRTDDGVVIDTTGKVAGRGAYIHPSRACWQIALETRRIEQALRQKLSGEERQQFSDFLAELPDAASDSPESAAEQNGTI